MSEVNYDEALQEHQLSDLHAVASIAYFLLTGNTKDAEDWKQDGYIKNRMCLADIRAHDFINKIFELTEVDLLYGTSEIIKELLESSWPQHQLLQTQRQNYELTNTGRKDEFFC